MRALLGVLCGFVLGACAHTGGGTAGAPPTSPGFVVVPMTLVHADSRETIVELQADGSVVEPRGQVVLRFSGDRFEDGRGQPLARLDSDGRLVAIADGSPDTARFDEQDRLRVSGPAGELTLWVDDDGAVVIAGDSAAGLGRVAFEGFRPAARRAAALVALLGAPGTAPPAPEPRAPAPGSGVTP